MTRRFFSIVVLALALVVGACGGSNPASPDPPTPAEPKWSTIWGVEVKPGSTVRVGQGTTILVVLNTLEAGILREATFVVTRPDGEVVTLSSASFVSQIVGVREAAGTGYQPPLPGKYSFTVTVKETKSGRQGPALLANGEFTAQ